MVVITPSINSLAPALCELKMESGRIIRYVAHESANPRKETSTCYDEIGAPHRKNSSHEPHLLSDEWEGVNCLCQAVDSIVEMENEHDFFHGKKVLEIGFTTGLPSVYAYENGAAEVSLHSHSKSSLNLYTKPTLRRNNIPMNKCKFSSGSLEDLKTALGGRKFDIILAPEILNRSRAEFDLLHDIIDDSLESNGVCILSSQTHYFNVDGCLESFLSIVKSRRRLDALEKWSSPRTDVVQRKVIQLTRSLL